MANMTFGPGRPLMTGAYGGMTAKPAMQKPYSPPKNPRQGPLAPKPVVDPAQALQQQFATPGGRPATDFGGVIARPAPAPIGVPQTGVQTGAAINDLAPPPTVAPAPRLGRGMTATRPQAKPYDPRMRRFGMRDPIVR